MSDYEKDRDTVEATLRTQLAASHELIIRLTEKMEKATSALLAGKMREDDLKAHMGELERTARALLSRKDFWVSAATLMALPGELDNLADLLTPLDAPCEKCERKLDPHYAYCRNCGTPRPGFKPMHKEESK